MDAKTKKQHDMAIRDAEGWLAEYKRTGDPKQLRLAIHWLWAAEHHVQRIEAAS